MGPEQPSSFHQFQIQELLVAGRILHWHCERIAIASDGQLSTADRRKPSLHAGAHFILPLNTGDALNKPLRARIVPSQPAEISPIIAISASGRCRTSQVHASTPAAIAKGVKEVIGSSTRKCRISLSIFGDAVRTEVARKRSRRISGTLNDLDFLRMFVTASAIWVLKASTSAAEDSVGDWRCKFSRPTCQQWTERLN